MVTKGEVFVSTLGSELKVRVLEAKKDRIRVAVERKLVDRKLGEISIVVNEREIPVELWPRFIRVYEKV